tara:strand:- start:949 stop:1482 length:534 start_codon:yes stop_codon:yes gene_type:complete
MELLFENWRQYLDKGYPGSGTPWSRGGSFMPVDPSTVRVVEGPLFWNHSLFVVVEYQSHEKTKKVGFYRSGGSSIADTEHTAGMWFPTYGIDLDKQWIIKHEDKYPHPDSELGAVAKALSRSPMAQQGESLRRQLARSRNTKRRSLGITMGELGDIEAEEINAIFSEHGVNNNETTV